VTDARPDRTVEDVGQSDRDVVGQRRPPDDPVEFVLDLVGQCPFERSSEREPGVAGTENGDTHSHALGPDG